MQRLLVTSISQLRMRGDEPKVIAKEAEHGS